MNLSQFLLILRARFWIILITFLVIVLTTIAVNVFVLPKSYTATTSLVLNYKGMDPVTGAVLPAQLMPGYMATQTDIINSKNVALKVVEQLKFTQSVTAIEQFNEATKGKGNINEWFADRLLVGLKVQPSKESSVLEISFSGADPDFAAIVANGFADAYIQTSLALKVDPAKKAADFLNEQTMSLRENVEAAQAKMSKYQQEKGITGVLGNMDVENARLNDLSSQLVAVQAQASEANSRLSNVRGNGVTSPDVASNMVIQGMKVEISRAEVKLSELSKRVGPSHPQYIAVKTELEKLKAELNREVQNVSNTVAGSARIYQQREAEIKAALAFQKEKVLKLNLFKDELMVLQRDVENAQRALDAASQRFTQASIEGNANQTDVAVLNPATAPQNAASPRTFLNVLLSIILGGILGLAFALLAEMMDRRVRSRDDLSDLLEVPVFAIIDGKPAKARKQLLKSSQRLIKAA
ncbi:MAG TPA: chain length determinant protein EpsF [Methylotenera sp.]|nr:chain length determinant protein EpsF [Methylotenera sp.]HPH06319.1 chain length determinant protein EpsF [Methylotenera sp.]HPN00336.1 chain length determinant protein EpsF [Methylotenera sp.]